MKLGYKLQAAMTIIRHSTGHYAIVPFDSELENQLFTLGFVCTTVGNHDMGYFTVVS
jgi:hypothetical protein